jgi:hypothetical protein
MAICIDDASMLSFVELTDELNHSGFDRLLFDGIIIKVMSSDRRLEINHKVRFRIIYEVSSFMKRIRSNDVVLIN